MKVLKNRGLKQNKVQIRDQGSEKQESKQEKAPLARLPRRPRSKEKSTIPSQGSPRLRMHYDLRDTPDQGSQRILNALEPGTQLPIHRHRDTSETVVMLRGKGRWNYYDGSGNLTDSFILSVDGDLRGISVPKGQWHNTESLQSGTVILECKDGPWQPLAEEDILATTK